MKNKKMIKRVGVVALAGIMATSFAGCKSQIDKSTLENASDKIYLQNEDNMELVVIGFENVYEDLCDKKERYGYFLNDEKTLFYDILSKETLDLEIYNDVYNIYYTSFENILSTEDYVVAKSVGYIDKDYLENNLEDSYYFYKKNDDYKLRTNQSNFNYKPYTCSDDEYWADMVKIDYEDSESKTEETTAKETTLEKVQKGLFG